MAVVAIELGRASEHAWAVLLDGVPSLRGVTRDAEKFQVRNAA